jgi:hypothetical protein
MNLLNKLKIKWFHIKLQILGNDALEKDGTAYIPCWECGRHFQTWVTYDCDWGLAYESMCPKCRKEGGKTEWQKNANINTIYSKTQN